METQEVMAAEAAEVDMPVVAADMVGVEEVTEQMALLHLEVLVGLAVASEHKVGVVEVVLVALLMVLLRYHNFY